MGNLYNAPKTVQVYGYVRISTPKQNIERQVRNIVAAYPDAIIIREVYTGTSLDRKEFNKLLELLKPGCRIVFDSVARMSRTAEEGYLLYRALFNQGIHLNFIKEPHIDTDVLRRAIERPSIPMTGTSVDIILKAVNEYLLSMVEEQIKLAFIQAEKEVEYLHQRTKEGIVTARMNGKQIGRPKGVHYVSKKYLDARELILKHDKEFGGTLSNKEMMALCKCSHNTYYDYKKQLREELYNKNNKKEE